MYLYRSKNNKHSPIYFLLFIALKWNEMNLLRNHINDQLRSLVYFCESFLQRYTQNAPTVCFLFMLD